MDRLRKRSITLLLCIVMTITMTPVAAFAEDQASTDSSANREQMSEEEAKTEPKDQKKEEEEDVDVDVPDVQEDASSGELVADQSEETPEDSIQDEDDSAEEKSAEPATDLKKTHPKGTMSKKASIPGAKKASYDWYDDYDVLLDCIKYDKSQSNAYKITFYDLVLYENLDWDWDEDDEEIEIYDDYYGGSYNKNHIYVNMYELNQKDYEELKYKQSYSDSEDIEEYLSKAGTLVNRFTFNKSATVDPRKMTDGMYYAFAIDWGNWNDGSEFEYSVESIPIVSSIDIDETEMLVAPPGVQLSCTYDQSLPLYATWTTDDETIVNISDGYIRPLKRGNCTVTVTLPNGQSDSCNVVAGDPKLPGCMVEAVPSGQESLKVSVSNAKAFEEIGENSYEYTLELIPKEPDPSEEASPASEPEPAGEPEPILISAESSGEASLVFSDLDMFSKYRVGVRSTVVYDGDTFRNDWTYVDVESSAWGKYIKPVVKVESAKVTPAALKITANKISYKKYPVKYQYAIKKAGISKWKTTESNAYYYTFMKLTNGKKYYYRVRGYTVINGTKRYGAWTKAKSIKVGIPVSMVKIKGNKNHVYSGKAVYNTLTATYNGSKATISYTKTKNKNVGRYTIKITGTGKYIGTRYVYYNILPQKTRIDWLGDYFKDYDYYNGAVYCNRITVGYQKVGGGVSGYRVQWKKGQNGSWKHCDISAKYDAIDLLVEDEDISYNGAYYVKVAAYKNTSNGKVWGSWSNTEKFYTYNRDVNFNCVYSYDQYITVRGKRAYAGDVIKIRVGGKVIKTQKITKDYSGNYKFRIYIGKQVYSRKIQVDLYNKFGDQIYGRYGYIWYAKAVKVGMTKSQVRWTWGAPSRKSTASGGWEYWYWGDGSEVAFHNGTVYYWYNA